MVIVVADPRNFLLVLGGGSRGSWWPAGATAGKKRGRETFGVAPRKKRFLLFWRARRSGATTLR